MEACGADEQTGVALCPSLGTQIFSSSISDGDSIFTRAELDNELLPFAFGLN